MNLFWEKDLHKWNWMPLVGYSECAVKVLGPSSWIYLEGPVLILTTFNVIMFILTFLHIWKTKSELKTFKRDRERTTSCFNIDTETYLMFMRISVIMGVIWILELVTFFDIGKRYLGPLDDFLSYFERSYGIIVFVMLILKRSTLQLLKERIKGKR
ncbi:probable G-protein coupled receptor Mth-like 7 [Drosophila biarmipes]|uniref:probable G-protein coupled receptor Mth-like 7 n=1 Tax=Drosophila biarmipes TaxID=125945 RepID=UPI0021CD179D|nr:probable G-protein coupled receptor Mth-like 7 [Drosophila biarmipes]